MGAAAQDRGQKEEKERRILQTRDPKSPEFLLLKQSHCHYWVLLSPMLHILINIGYGLGLGYGYRSQGASFR